MKITITPFNYPEDSNHYRGSEMKCTDGNLNPPGQVNSHGEFTEDFFLFIHFLRQQGVKIKPQTIILETLP
jgi:hypothetical protein